MSDASPHLPIVRFDMKEIVSANRFSAEQDFNLLMQAFKPATRCLRKRAERKDSPMTVRFSTWMSWPLLTSSANRSAVRRSFFSASPRKRRTSNADCNEGPCLTETAAVLHEIELLKEEPIEAEGQDVQRRHEGLLDQN